MIIREATPEDAVQLIAIYNPFIRNSIATFEEIEITAEEMADRIVSIENIGAPFLIAEKDETISGYAYASLWKARSAYRHTIEVSVYVDSHFHGRGLGRALYTQLFSILHKMDYHAVMGVITLPNDASVHLHESFGLQKVAHFAEVGRKFNQWIDVGYWQGFLQDMPKTPAD